jgi:aminoglycoside phosphotransferase (APT) family kinase protein
MTAGARSASRDTFLKHYASDAAAELARRRSAAACAAGVPTPAVRGDDGPRVLCFDRITTQIKPTLDDMIRMLACLKAMPADGLDRFDPFMRIRPRFATTAPRIRKLIDEMQARDAVLRWPASAVVHGDFHPGQVMRDHEGRVWLIDLDDMALAPREADLGNLAAWLATQAPGQLNDLTARALAQVLELAQTADPGMTRHFFGIALVRRALKLQEQAADWVIDQLPLRA